MDLYTTLPWQALCEQVAVLKIQRRSGVTPIPRNPVSAQEAAPAETDELLQCCYRHGASTKKPLSHGDLGALEKCPGRDSKSRKHVSGRAVSWSLASNFRRFHGTKGRHMQSRASGV